MSMSIMFVFLNYFFAINNRVNVEAQNFKI